jgi:hypothetical protein
MFTAFATFAGVHNLLNGIVSVKPGTDDSSGSIPVAPTVAGATSLTEMLYSARRDEMFFIIQVNPALDAA